jgi:outer membrane protein assembly factor BamB
MSDAEELIRQQLDDALERLVFVGVNSRVAALDRYSGDLVWQWKSPKGTAEYVAVLLDGDRLIVSVQGYTYCLNPVTGGEVWANPLKGFGVGVPGLASRQGGSTSSAAAMLIEEQKRRSKTSGD